MFIKSLLKQHKYRSFDYRPRHYDTTRDRINEKRLQNGFDPIESNTSSELKRMTFRKHLYDSKRLHADGNTNFRIALIFVILCSLCYIVFRFMDLK